MPPETIPGTEPEPVTPPATGGVLASHPASPGECTTGRDTGPAKAPPPARAEGSHLWRCHLEALAAAVRANGWVIEPLAAG